MIYTINYRKEYIYLKLVQNMKKYIICSKKFVKKKKKLLNKYEFMIFFITKFLLIICEVKMFLSLLIFFISHNYTVIILIKFYLKFFSYEYFISKNLSLKNLIINYNI